ncbi:MAG: cytidine deaminase [Pseudomonadota bacterium]
MRRQTVTKADLELIEAARRVIKALYAENRHHIGAAARTRSGRVYTAVHLDTYVGRASVCAEAIAIGKALAEGDRDIECLVSVRHPRPREKNREIAVVSPCGICRELLADFTPHCTVIIPANRGLARVPVIDLLPSKYVRLT